MATKRQATKRTVITGKRRTLDAVVRVSRLNGREGETFHSPEMQEGGIRSWAKHNGVRIGRVFDETDSVSGGTTEREGLQGAMARALDGTTDGIVVLAVDRFARNMVEGVGEIKRLTDAGASFVAVEHGIDTGTTNAQAASMSNLMLGFMFLIAQWQREMLAEKWEGVRERHINRGVGTQTPYGYRKNAHHVLVIEPDEARHVVTMFERRARGESWSHIARAITVDGARTINGNAWTPQRVRDAVHRRVYLGEISSGADIINTAAHEAIVTPALWHAAHARTGRGTEARGKASDSGLLTGLVRCATCGGTMKLTKPSAGGAARGTRQRYACRRTYGWGVCDAPVSVVAADIEAFAVKAFHADALAHLDAEGVDTTDALDAAEAALQRAQMALTAWATDLTLDAMRADFPDEYAAGTKARTDAVTHAREARDREREASGVRAVIPANLGDVWADLTPEEQRSWLRAWFSVIAVTKAARRGDAMAKRVALFTVDDSDTPDGFVINDVGADGRGRRVAMRRPIAMR